MHHLPIHLRPTGEPHPIRRRGTALLAGLLVIVGLAACQPPPPRNAATAYVTGNASGASASLSAPAGLGADVAPVASQGMPCNPSSGATYQNAATNTHVNIPAPLAPVHAVNLDDVKDTGTATFDRVAGTAELRVPSTVQGVNLLNGLVTATAVEARAHETLSGSGTDTHLTDDTTGVTLTDLRIGGVLQATDAAAGTRIDVPGVGYVVLGEVTAIPAYFGTPPRVSVDAVHVHVDNFLGVSGDIRIAHAQAGLADARGRLSGGAFVAQAQVQPVLSTGVVGNVAVPCFGTNGADVGADVAALDLGPLGSVGVGHTTVNGAIPTEGPTTRTSASVTGINLLGGTITADAIVAHADSHAGPGGADSDADGSTFTNLVIAGRALPVTAAPNTRIDLAGLGYVTLNEQLEISDGNFGSGPAQHTTAIYVSGLHLHVTAANSLGLPVGADLVLARATSTASA